MQTTFIFCHIPKTAGTSLRSALEANFKPHEILPDKALMYRNGGKYPLTEPMLEIYKYQGENVRLIVGHYNFAVKKSLADMKHADMKCIVVLREPIARAISHIHHVMHKDGVSKSDVLAALDAGRMAPRVRPNVMTWVMGNKFGDNAVNQKSLDNAIKNLRSVDFLGTVENIQPLVEKLANFGLPIELGVHNKTPKGIDLELTDRQMDTLRIHHRFDIDLYAEARAILDEV